jgi:hypothetical protein
MPGHLNVKFFPVVFQRALPVSDNTIIDQLQDIQKSAAKQGLTGAQ